MQKLKIQAATLIVLFVVAVATATTYRVDMDEENPGRQCRQQQLNACRQYLRESHQNDWREEFQRCCQQLEETEEECRCDGIRRIVEEQRRQGELRGREMQEMMTTAESLPALCRMSPRRCDVGAVSF